MKRRDLKPGTIFRYTWPDGITSDLFWVPVPGGKCPEGVMTSLDPLLDEQVIVVMYPDQTQPDEAPAEKKDEEVDLHTNPSHYTRLSPQPIEVIESWGLNFHRGAALKYIARAGHKDGVDEVTDLRKAVAFLEREIARVERSRNAAD